MLFQRDGDLTVYILHRSIESFPAERGAQHVVSGDESQPGLVERGHVQGFMQGAMDLLNVYPGLLTK